MSPRVRAVPVAPMRRALSAVVVVLLAVPLVELAVGVAVARRIGAGATVGLILLGCLGGLWVLRWAGSGAMRELRRVGQAGGVEPGAVGRDAGDTGLKLVAGLLLLFPGLVTDVLGLLLLVPGVRGAVGRSLGHRLRRRFEIATRRVTVRGETVEGVTVTSWVEDLPAEPPDTTKPPLPAGPAGEEPRPRRP